MRAFTFQYTDDQEFLKWLKSCNASASPAVLVQIFSGSMELDLLNSITEALFSQLPHAIIIGSTSSGEIFEGRMLENTIVISLMAFEHTTLKSIHLTGEDSKLLGQQAAKAIANDDTRAVILFADGLLCNGDAILDGFYDYSNKNIIISGGMASDNHEFKNTWLIHNKEIFEGGLVAVALSNPDLHVFHAYNLGWYPLGKEMSITKAQGNRVYEIDNMPIQEVYAKYLGDQVVDKMPGSTVEFPLIFERNGVYIARSMVHVYEDGSGLFAGNIPMNRKVRFGIGHHELLNKKSIENYRLACASSVEALFVYACSARKMYFGSELEFEFDSLAQVAPLSGFFTYGEFYHSNAGNQLLNITTTILGLSESHDAFNNLDSKYLEVRADNLSTSALTHLVDVTMRELENESIEHNKTILALKEAEIALSQLAVSDPLTEVLNRRGMQKYFETLLANMGRTKKQGALIFFDIDKFKPFNDLYGHKAGDELLKNIATKIKSNIRSIDAVARFGGDEFIIIVSDLHPGIEEAFEEAKIITEKISSLLCVSYTVKTWDNQAIEQKVTVSSGFSLFDDTADCETVIASADEAMYRRKNKKD
ncbi:MAG: GGDEF domain-containing protein [Sulfuricurvum sp.]|nr:GGDEF domain-containing protein [Sulfuricurvum sp.]